MIDKLNCNNLIMNFLNFKVLCELFLRTSSVPSVQSVHYRNSYFNLRQRFFLLLLQDTVKLLQVNHKE